MENRNDDVPSVGRSNDDYITNTFYSAKLGLSNFFRLGRDWDERLGREREGMERVYYECWRSSQWIPSTTIVSTSRGALNP